MWNMQTHRDVFFYICSCAAKTRRSSMFSFCGDFLFPVSTLFRLGSKAGCGMSWLGFFVNNQFRIIVDQRVAGSDNLENIFQEICAESAKLWQSWTHGKSPFICKEFGLFMNNLSLVL